MVAEDTERRISVVLFNLGGPDRLQSVRPFLFNLFNDRAIISLPQPVRWLLAQLISRVRERTAIEIYRRMGGGSPLAEETEVQRQALETLLSERLDARVQVVVAMRYWRPFTRDAAAAVERFGPAKVVLLPLYPQFSTTTTGSSLGAWRRAYRGGGEVRAVCCYPEEESFLDAHVEVIRGILGERHALSSLRLIFSAHGLPERVILGGDPYQDQIERTSRRVAERLGAIDWTVSYQSRVGPLKWIGPSTLEVLEQAGQEKRGVLVTPVAFVSEHSETLVELDIEYRELAEEAGVPVYLRAPAIGAHPAYISALAEMVARRLEGPAVAPCSKPCDPGFAACPFRLGAAA
jgi:ferrochelatase